MRNDNKINIHYQIKDKRNNILQDNIPDVETAKAVCVAIQRNKDKRYRYLDIYIVTSKPFIEDLGGM